MSRSGITLKEIPTSNASLLNAARVRVRVRRYPAGMWAMSIFCPFLFGGERLRRSLPRRRSRGSENQVN